MRIERLAREDNMMKLPLINQLITGYGHCKDYPRAKFLYYSMKDMGIQPDVVTYNSLIMSATVNEEVNHRNAFFL
jgi:pentatricopeptide repeat protein